MITVYTMHKDNTPSLASASYKEATDYAKAQPQPTTLKLTQQDFPTATEAVTYILQVKQA